MNEEPEQHPSEQPHPDSEHDPGWWRLPGLSRRDRDSDEDSTSERLTQQLAAQWALIRAERVASAAPLPIRGGQSDFRPARVPFGVDLAAAWAWRFMVIAAAVLGILWLLDYFLVVTLPLVIALLLASLASPVVHRLSRYGLPRPAAALIMMIVGLGLMGLMLTFVGQQIVQGGQDVADSVASGLGEIRVWLRDGPLQASDSQINSYIKQAQDTITAGSQDGAVVSQVTEVGAALGHVLAGFFIALFSTYFFMADGSRIWSWFVRLSPRAARERIDSSGQVAWASLTAFVRVTVIIALVDSLGVMLVAGMLGVPFVLAIGVLVFIGAFIPMVGATLAGGVAVLVALVDQGPITALLMLGGVILVQQIEGHVLQPFVMGRFVSVHPLGVIVAIACGVLVAGIPGALIAVPMVAVLNAVVLHLSEERSDPDPSAAAQAQARTPDPELGAEPALRDAPTGS